MKNKKILLLFLSILFCFAFAFISGCHKNNSEPATISLSIQNTATVKEGAPASLTVTLSGSSSSIVKVYYYTTAGTAVSNVDFQAAMDSVVFSPGQKSETIIIQTYLNGTLTQGSQNFTVSLENPTNAGLGASVATVSIQYGPLPTNSYYIFGTVSGTTWYQSGLQSLTAYYDDYPTYVAGTGGEWLGSSYQDEASVTLELYTQQAPNANGFYAMLAPGNYAYVNTNVTSGAYITFMDSKGVQWTSLGDQTGSSFTITSLASVQSGAFQTTFAGKFSCKLYDGNGNVKTLTNGFFNSEAGLTY